MSNFSVEQDYKNICVASIYEETPACEERKYIGTVIYLEPGGWQVRHVVSEATRLGRDALGMILKPQFDALKLSPVEVTDEKPDLTDINTALIEIHARFNKLREMIERFKKEL